MIEPEMAFADLSDDMDNAEAYVKYVVRHVLDTCADDLTVFTNFVDKGRSASAERLTRRSSRRTSRA